MAENGTQLLQSLLSILEDSRSAQVADDVRKLLQQSMKRDGATLFSTRIPASELKEATVIAMSVIVAWVWRFQRLSEFEAMFEQSKWLDQALGALFRIQFKRTYTDLEDITWQVFWDDIFPNPKNLVLALPRVRRRISHDSIQIMFSNGIRRAGQMFRDLRKRRTNILGESVSLFTFELPEDGTYKLSRRHQRHLNLALAVSAKKPEILKTLKETPRPFFLHVKNGRRSFFIDREGWVHPLVGSALLQNTRHEGWRFLSFLLEFVATNSEPNDTITSDQLRRLFEETTQIASGISNARLILDHHHLDPKVEITRHGKGTGSYYVVKFPFPAILLQLERSKP